MHICDSYGYFVFLIVANMQINDDSKCVSGSSLTKTPDFGTDGTPPPPSPPPSLPSPSPRCPSPPLLPSFSTDYLSRPRPGKGIIIICTCLLPKSFTLPSYYVLLFHIFVHITMIVIYLFCLRKQIPLKKIWYMWLFKFLNIDTLKMHKKKLEKS